MKSTGIFYGSTTGNTKEMAHKLAELLSIPAEHVHDVADTAPTKAGDYQVLILGTSTWGDGDLQDDWEDFVHGLQALDLRGKQIALFGCGDETMTDTFCDGVGRLYDALRNTGAEFVGQFNAEGYDFGHSKAEHDGHIVGLLLDNVNHPEMTPERLDMWATQVKSQTAD